VEVVLLFPVLPSEAGEDELFDPGEPEVVLEVSFVMAELLELVEPVGGELVDV
jgi:hypothetical protein